MTEALFEILLAVAGVFSVATVLNWAAGAFFYLRSRTAKALAREAEGRGGDQPVDSDTIPESHYHELAEWDRDFERVTGKFIWSDGLVHDQPPGLVPGQVIPIESLEATLYQSAIQRAAMENIYGADGLLSQLGQQGLQNGYFQYMMYAQLQNQSLSQQCLSSQSQAAFQNSSGLGDPLTPGLQLLARRLAQSRNKKGGHS